MANETAKHKAQWEKTLISTRTMAEDDDKHKNKANEAAKHKTMPNELANHKNNANESAKHKNNGRKR